MRTTVLALGLAAAIHGPAAMAQAKSGHVAVNGVNYYYEIHGQRRAASAAARRARLDRHVQAGAADAGEEPARDRRRPARPRPHRARRARDQPGRHGRRHGGDPEAARPRAGRRAGLFARRRRRIPARRAASRDGAPAGAGLGRVCAGRLLSGDAADAGAGGRGDGRADEGDADVQVLHGGGAQAGGFPAPARPHGRADAQALRLVRGREEAADAGHAGLRRQRHVPPRAHRAASTSCWAAG